MLLGFSARSWKVRLLDLRVQRQGQEAEVDSRTGPGAAAHQQDEDSPATIAFGFPEVLWVGYDRHMAEVLRYDINYGMHNGDPRRIPQRGGDDGWRSGAEEAPRTMLSDPIIESIRKIRRMAI